MLGDLVSEGSLTEEQARRVTEACATRARPAPPPPPAPAPWRQRLLEAAVYLGSAFVVAAVATLIGRQWADFSRAFQITLVSGLATAGLVTGLTLALPVRTHLGRPLDPAHAVRRRSASTILTATAALAAAAVALVLDDARVTAPAAAVAALLVMVTAQVVATSVLSELGLLAASVAVVVTTLGEYLPEQVRTSTEAWDTERTIMVALIGLGALWAWGVSRVLRYRVLAVAVGLALCLQAAPSLGGPGAPAPLLATAVLAVATLLTYLRDAAWPWLVAAVLSATAFVFLTAGETFGPAVAFLVAGLALLGGVAVVVLTRRRREARRPAP